jgi:hypothetical protein
MSQPFLFFLAFSPHPHHLVVVRERYFHVVDFSTGKHSDSVRISLLAELQFDRSDFCAQHCYTPQQLAKRIADVSRLEIAGCYFVKHRGKESEVISANKGDLDIGALCRGPIEVSRAF